MRRSSTECGQFNPTWSCMSAAMTSTPAGPRIGLVIAKSVGNAVQRHRVARKLRHVAKAVLAELDPSERVVIRALPGSSDAISARLEQELRKGLRRSHDILAGTR